MSNDPESPCRCDDAAEHDAGGCDFGSVPYAEIVGAAS